MSMWSEITSFAWAATKEKIFSGVRTQLGAESGSPGKIRSHVALDRSHKSVVTTISTA